MRRMLIFFTNSGEGPCNVARPAHSEPAATRTAHVVAISLYNTSNAPPATICVASSCEAASSWLHRLAALRSLPFIWCSRLRTNSVALRTGHWCGRVLEGRRCARSRGGDALRGCRGPEHRRANIPAASRRRRDERVQPERTVVRSHWLGIPVPCPGAFTQIRACGQIWNPILAVLTSAAIALPFAPLVLAWPRTAGSTSALIWSRIHEP